MLESFGGGDFLGYLPSRVMYVIQTVEVTSRIVQIYCLQGQTGSIEHYMFPKSFVFGLLFPLCFVCILFKTSFCTDILNME